MSKYIDAEWLEENAKQYSLGYYDYDEWATPLNVLDSAPSIDICFCKDCEYDGTWKCPLALIVDSNDFCSYGERKDNA